MTTVHPREFSTRARGGIRVGALEQAAGEGWSPHPTRRAGRAGKQSVAIANVHHRNGFDVTKGGYEFKVALMAIAAGLLLGGPGRVSIHQMIDRALARRPMAMVATVDEGCDDPRTHTRLLGPCGSKIDRRSRTHGGPPVDA